MSEGSRTSWAPWRGPNAVRWTLALALCVFAVVAFLAAVPPPGRRTPSVPPLATWAALLALGLALWASVTPRERRPWPWHRPHPLRNTVAFVVPFVGMGLVLLAPLSRRLVGGELASIAFPLAFTLLFVSSVASTERGSADRVFSACIAGFWWWSWYLWPMR